jgi:2-polyprenyl-3-methyl-5-hydroxy-6-metoxy-1,4-benzoquinol methylase
MIEDPQSHYGIDEYSEDKYIQNRIKKGCALVYPFLKKDSKVLDIGGYDGSLESYLPSQVVYHLMDFDEEALNRAELKHNALTRKVKFDEGEMEWDGQLFDVIFCTEVLEHLKDPHRHLEEIKKMLKPGGRLLVSLPNENMLYHRIMSVFGMGIDMMAFDLYKHLHFPTIKQSNDLLEKYFKVTTREYYIVMSFKATRIERFGKLFNLIPDAVWQGLANLMPGMFARGIIFSCELYDKK